MTAPFAADTVSRAMGKETVLVRESERATVTPHGWLDIRLG